MQIKQRLNVSGFRGTWGENLNKEIVSGYTRAFAKFTKEESGKENPTILIGRDGRESGPEIKDIIISELKKLKVNFIDGDVLPTPTVLFSVRKHSYDGAIIITASHNPIEYNGLKFVNKNAFFATKEEVTKINESFEQESNANTEDEILENNSEKTEIPNFIKEHTDQILSKINTEIIKKKKFKIAVDMINASACVIDPYLFEQLNVELILVNNTPDGKFAHKPEPLKENLQDVANLVKKSGAVIGFAHDPDADRLVVINELGEVIFEEYTLALCIENILSKNQNNNIAINLSSSRMSEDIAEKYKSTCVRSKVGEANVVEEMIKNNSVIGGEGNGGVIFPAINFARDSFAGIALILELLAERNLKVSECVKMLPKYFMKKDKMLISENLSNLNNMYEKLKKHFPEAKTSEIDGLYLSFPDKSWIHLRPSNTEPIIRLFGEALEESRIEALFGEVKLTLGL
jgi:phosphomannomutase